MNKALPLVRQGLILNPFIHIYSKLLLFHRKLGARKCSIFLVGLYQSKSINYFICLTIYYFWVSYFHAVILLLMILKSISLNLSEVFSILEKISVHRMLLCFLLIILFLFPFYCRHFFILCFIVCTLLPGPSALQSIQPPFLCLPLSCWGSCNALLEISASSCFSHCGPHKTDNIAAFKSWLSYSAAT